MNLINRYFKDFISLIFPNLCCACGTSLVQYEHLICIKCIYQLPYTNFHLNKDNTLAKQFWGRVRVNSAAAFLMFNKRGKVQRLMHQLKYNNHPEIGVELGRLYGLDLKKSEYYQEIEVIIPVPLHPKKQKKRGYNQSEQFAIGLSKSLEKPVDTKILKRIKYADSQALMNRNQRHENMKTVFQANGSSPLPNHVLLVDDTITTGATLEACVLELNKIGIKNIHIAGIAFTA